MASRNRPKLTVETIRADRTGAAAMPWWLAAAGGAVVCALAGWAVIAAIVLLDQLVATGSVSVGAVDVASRLWLLAHGGVFQWDGYRVGLVPLTLTGLVALSLHGVAGYAGKQAILAIDQPPSPGVTTAKIAATLAGAYAVVVVVVALIVGQGGPELRAGGGALILAVIMAFLGARKALGWSPQRAWPVWARAIPRSMLTGVVTLLGGGAVGLVGALWSHRDQYIAVSDALQPGAVGVMSLSLLQLAWAPNLIVWVGSWTTGAGFTVADGSTVSLMGGQVGLLPGFPISAALSSGPASWWSLVWLIVPLAAGGLAAGVVLRARPRARFDETALVGGLAGVLSGAGFTLVALTARGGLGTARLAGLGPAPLSLLIMSGVALGLAGLVTGLVAGLIRRPAQAADPRWWSRWNDAGAVKPADAPRLYQPAVAKPSWIVPSKPASEPTAATRATVELKTPRSPAKPKDSGPSDQQPPLDFYGQSDS